MFAVMFGRDNMAKLLAAAGADPDAVDSEGVSARDVAEGQGRGDLFTTQQAAS